MEQRSVKVISRLPANLHGRFKSLYVFSSESSKIDDLFEKEVRELSEAFEKRKLPFIEKRNQIVAGTMTDFDDSIVEYE